MSSSAFDDKASEFAVAFSTFTIEQQNHVMKELFKRCNPLQLRMLMADVGPVTSVDFVNYFPPDVTEEIFSWLDVRSLCCVAYCSRLWRKRANSDNIWWVYASLGRQAGRQRISYRRVYHAAGKPCVREKVG